MMFKRWTVILIPHDRGHRRSFGLHTAHMWAAAGLVVFLFGLSGFLYSRERAYSDAARQLREENHVLEAALKSGGMPRSIEEHLAEKESEIRAHYELRDRIITDELKRLYDLEREVRIVSGLPARSGSLQEDLESPGEGQGGPPGDPDAGEVYEYDDSDRMNPPELIYGLSSPSADLILQEMALRMGSMSKLVVDMEAKHQRLAHTPLAWPTEDERRRINSRFGRRKDPFTQQHRHHGGVDVSASYGSPILSTADGVVTFSGYHQLLGHCVKIDHGYGIETWYGHMSKRLVNKGDAVKRGDVIGKVGSTGRSTGPHIHYEVHLNDMRVDPRNYIGR